MGCELELLITRDVLVTLGRSLAHPVPTLSDDFGVDLVFGSLGIVRMTLRGHRVDQNEIGG